MLVRLGNLLLYGGVHVVGALLATSFVVGSLRRRHSLRFGQHVFCGHLYAERWMRAEPLPAKRPWRDDPMRWDHNSLHYKGEHR
jgi:hypothetical protein